MRILIVAIITIGFCSCKKQDKPNQITEPVCTLSSVITNSGRVYSFDTSGRILSMNQTSGLPTTYAYQPGLVKVTNGPNETIYFINNDGLADSSHVKFIIINSTTGQPDTNYSRNWFTYENEYLVKQTVIGKHLMPFNQYVDTVVRNYSYENGNLKKISSLQGSDVIYHYHTLLANNNPFLDPRRPVLRFLGKASKNIVDKEVDSNGNLQLLYIYLFDEKGRVTNQRVLNGTSTTESMDFVYDCH